jgi:hypothetical protein
MELSTVTRRKRRRNWKPKIKLSRTMRKSLQILSRKCIRKEMRARTLMAVLTLSTVRKSLWYLRKIFLLASDYHHRKKMIMWSCKLLGRLSNQALMTRIRSQLAKRRGLLLEEVRRALLPQARLRGPRSQMVRWGRHKFLVIPLIWKIGGLEVKKIIMKASLTHLRQILRVWSLTFQMLKL